MDLARAKSRVGVGPLFRILSQKLFEHSGFTWDLRRSGDLKLGMWRKKLGSRSRKKATASKRFVLTPGFGDSPNTWLLVVSLLAPILKRNGYDEVVLLDFPGFNGRLTSERCFPSMDLLQEAVGDLFDWLEPEMLFGHSLGGWLSARYAADCGNGLRPKNKRRHGYEGPAQVLLVAPAGAYESEKVREEVAQIFSDLASPRGFAALRPHLFAKEPAWFDWVVQDMGRFAADSGIHQFTQSVRSDHLLDERLSDIRARLWLIWGDRDTLVPTSGLQSWLAGLTRPECLPRGVLIRGAGHSPHLEKPAVFAAILSQILLGKIPHVKGARWWNVVEPPKA